MALRISAGHRAPISLMITDVVMRGMNGRALADELRLTRPETKLLSIAGHADDGLFRHGVRPLARIFLHKPYTPG